MASLLGLLSSSGFRPIFTANVRIKKKIKTSKFKFKMSLVALLLLAYIFNWCFEHLELFLKFTSEVCSLLYVFARQFVMLAGGTCLVRREGWFRLSRYSGPALFLRHASCRRTRHSLGSQLPHMSPTLSYTKYLQTAINYVIDRYLYF